MVDGSVGGGIARDSRRDFSVEFFFNKIRQTAGANVRPRLRPEGGLVLKKIDAPAIAI